MMRSEALAQRVAALTASLSGTRDDVVAVGRLLEDLLRERTGVRGSQLQALVKSALPKVDRQVGEALREVARIHQAVMAEPGTPRIDTRRFVNSATLALRSLAAPHVGEPHRAGEAAGEVIPGRAVAGDGSERGLLLAVLFITTALVLAVLALAAVVTLPDAPAHRAVSRGSVVEWQDAPPRERTARAVPAPVAPPAAPAPAAREPVRPTLRAHGEVVLQGTGDARDVAMQLRRALGLLPPEDQPTTTP